MVDIVITKDYGYVLATYAAGALYLLTLSVQTGVYRAAAKVPYPHAYATEEEAKKDPKKHLFNCAQRVHQNNLEMFPVYSTLMLIAGIKYPKYASAAGAFCILTRFIYSAGYLTGNPDKRIPGQIGILGLLALFGLTGKTLRELIR